MDFKRKNGANHKTVAWGALQEEKNLSEKNECKYDSHKIYNRHMYRCIDRQINLCMCVIT